LSHPENEHTVQRAIEKGRALAGIAVELNDRGRTGYRKFFDSFAAAAGTWSSAAVPVNTPYYALVASAYRAEVDRLLDGLSSPPDGRHT
jgi:predicted RNA polymerase sigma factor